MKTENIKEIDELQISALIAKVIRQCGKRILREPFPTIRRSAFLPYDRATVYNRIKCSVFKTNK